MWLFIVTQYNSSLSSFVPNFRALSQVVAERKKVYKQGDRQTNIVTEKAKTIYSNILRTGGIINMLKPTQNPPQITGSTINKTSTHGTVRKSHIKLQ